MTVEINGKAVKRSAAASKRGLIGEGGGEVEKSLKTADLFFAIGIDPGVNTGLAVWDMKARDLLKVCSLSIVEAMDEIDTIRRSAEIIVRFEDARLRTWFGSKGKESLQGAGSIKRDCQIWESWLLSRGIPYKAVKPAKGATKWDAGYFRKVTGWSQRTNEHARDAALLVWGK